MDRRGSVVAIVVLALTAILGFGAIVLDSGLLYWQKARLQNAVDAAALAGAHAMAKAQADGLGSGELAGQAAIQAVADTNGLDDGEWQATLDSSELTVALKANRTVGLGLARLLGVAQADVAVDAMAGAFSLSGMKRAVPLGVVWQDFQFGQQYDLKLGDGVTGNYGALALGGTGAANYRDNLQNGYASWIRTGDLIPTETGNMSNPTKVAVDSRIATCNHQPACTYDHLAPDCARVVIVPIISALPNGRGEVSVLGFAAFFLEGVGGQGGDNFVRGRFVRMFAHGEVGVAADFGVQTVKLLR